MWKVKEEIKEQFKVYLLYKGVDWILFTELRSIIGGEISIEGEKMSKLLNGLI